MNSVRTIKPCLMQTPLIIRVCFKFIPLDIHTLFQHQGKCSLLACEQHSRMLMNIKLILVLVIRKSHLDVSRVKTTYAVELFSVISLAFARPHFHF
jgi:hypothetical protein